MRATMNQTHYFHVVTYFGCVYIRIVEFENEAVIE